MSELKSETIYFTHENGEAYAVDMYLKSEADKVIAEKDKEIRHHKYKRCLDMAKLCNEKWFVHNFAEIPTKLGFYDRWEKRWLELAEKFKEAK